MENNGSIIYDAQNVVPVSSNHQLVDRLLNGVPATMNGSNIAVESGGFYNITAIKNGCFTPVSVKLR